MSARNVDRDGIKAELEGSGNNREVSERRRLS